MTYGKFPLLRIDHINQNKIDNRIQNLREVSHAENLQNRGATRKNTTGAKGVSFDKRKEKFYARITAFNKKYYLGRFDKLEDAKNAYRIAALKLHIQPLVNKGNGN